MEAGVVLVVDLVEPELPDDRLEVVDEYLELLLVDPYFRHGSVIDLPLAAALFGAVKSIVGLSSRYGAMNDRQTRPAIVPPWTRPPLMSI